MKLLTILFVLALYSTPLLAAESISKLCVDAALQLAAGNTANAYLHSLFGDYEAPTAIDTATNAPVGCGINVPDPNSGAKSTTAATDMVASTYATATGHSETVITAIAQAAGNADTAALLTSLNTLLDKIVVCGNTANNAGTGGDLTKSKSACVCGSAAPATSGFNWNYAVPGGDTIACASGIDLVNDEVLLFNRWLDTGKVPGSGVGQLPGFTPTEITDLTLAGNWDTAECSAPAAAGDPRVVSGCSAQYNLLLALWESTTVTTAMLDVDFKGHVPSLLAAYQMAVGTGSVWDMIADFFTTDAGWADDNFSLSDLQDVFCTAGALNTQKEVVSKGGKWSTGTFNAAFIAFLAAEFDFDADTDFAFSSTAGFYDELTAICPGVGGDPAVIAEAWYDLLTGLSVSGYGDETLFEHVSDCNPKFEVTEDTPEDKLVPATTLCGTCPAVGAEATEADAAAAIVRSLENLNCVEAVAPPPTPAPLPTDVAPDCDQDVTDKSDPKFCTPEMLKIIEALDAADSGRGFVIGISLLATLALLQK